jgi:F-type H+-transporting ATPase subunit beta
MVFGQMNEPPGARLRVALSALTQAEYFRDYENKDVLLFIDNIFRFTQAASVSARRAHAQRSGNQPTLWHGMGDSRNASPRPRRPDHLGTGWQACRRHHRPCPATTFTHLDGSIVLSRQIAELGIYPPGGPLFDSRILIRWWSAKTNKRTRRAAGVAALQGTCRIPSPSSA